MKWRGGRRSSNVDDRRGQSAGLGRGSFRIPGSRRGIRLPGGLGRRGGMGIGTMLIILVVMWIFGIDPSVLLQGGGGLQMPSTQTQTQPAQRSAEENELADFVSVVLADTEDTWHAIFKEEGGTYREPTLVLFTDAVQSACGFAQSAVGPFYCPGDSQVYIDLGFFRDLRARFGAPGDFAQAYVVAHEVAHHVQNLLGISGKVQQMRRQVSQSESNALSVRLELQADCLSGVWANRADKARDILEAGDIEEALGAASAIGDDRIQKQAGRRVTPDSFTHGSSAQRVRWFKRGLESGQMGACDTFGTDRL